MKKLTETKVALLIVALIEVLFITLRLFDVIDWGWIWVLTTPIWGTIGLYIFIVLIFMIIGFFKMEKK